MVVGIRSFLQRSAIVAIYATVAIGALSGVVALQWRRSHQPVGSNLSPQQVEDQEILQMKGLKYVPTNGFGFNNMIADWAFLRFLQYSGDDNARQITGYRASPAIFDLITKRDPRFQAAYVFSSGTLSYDLGQPELAVEYLQRGTDALDPRIHAGSYHLWVLRGLDELLLLNRIEEARSAYTKAADWAALSPNPEERRDEPVLRRVSNFLASEPDNRTVRYWAWSTVFDQSLVTKNLKTQVRAREELLTMGAIEGKDEKTGQPFFKPPAMKRPVPVAKPESKPPRVLPTPKPESPPIPPR
jgi:hypothetical protein